jgi:hypothetical protein
VTAKGGKGGSRIDITPDPSAPQTIARTVESKLIDLSKYRDASGNLDIPRLRAVINGDVEQVLKHQEALRSGVKADLPSRESLTYTLKNAKPGEAEQFQDLLRNGSRAATEGVKGGVLQNVDGSLHTASGKPLAPASQTPPPDAPSPKTGVGNPGEAGFVTIGFLRDLGKLAGHALTGFVVGADIAKGDYKAAGLHLVEGITGEFGAYLGLIELNYDARMGTEEFIKDHPEYETSIRSAQHDARYGGGI